MVIGAGMLKRLVFTQTHSQTHIHKQCRTSRAVWQTHQSSLARVGGYLATQANCAVTFISASGGRRESVSESCQSNGAPAEVSSAAVKSVYRYIIVGVE